MSEPTVEDYKKCETLDKTKEIQIELLPVKSGNIRAVGYSKEHQILRVAFNNGSLYQYVNVIPDVYAQLVKADSIGSMFARTIRDFYQCIRIA